MTKPDADKKSSPVEATPSDGGSIRETLESITIAFILAFIFRAFIVEAFVIPTGSMAPTLLGQHVKAACPQCGYEFTMGPRDQAYLTDGTQVARPTQGERYDRDSHGQLVKASDPLRFHCPMCRYRIDKKVMATDAGDRILVLKYVYTFNEPERWDVVVFKNPEDPDVNYIKRLVGLPNEQLRITGGDIYTRPFDATDDAQWQIQPKPDHVQRAVWQPVYHSDYFPLDHGEPGKSEDGGRSTAWVVPWQATGRSAASWTYDPTGPRWRFDASQGQPGELAFRFRQPDGKDDLARTYFAYNTITGVGAAEGDDGFADMRVAVTLVPHAAGARATLTCSSFDTIMRARIEPDGQAVLQTVARPKVEPGDDDGELDVDSLADWKTVAKSAEPVSLPIDKATRVELWHVDGELSLLVNGDRVHLKPEGGEGRIDRFVIGRDAGVEEARTVMGHPIVRIGVQGAPVTLRAADLDRDLYHTSLGQRGTREPARIRDGYYFCLGDNSPQSKDGRLWNMVNPWVRHMVGPELGGDERQQEASLLGYVPRPLMIGRAFFVYYPAPHRLSPLSAGVVPNFGRMRFIR